MQNNYLIVAKLGKTVGLKGQIKIYIDSDFPEQFKKGFSFKTNKNKILTIESINLKSKIVKFAEINDIDEAKKYVNSQLLISVKDTKKNCKLNTNQYFWFDIIGCEIFEDGINIGIIKDIHRYPLDDYLEVHTNLSISIETVKKLPKTFLIPYNENYILDVNIDMKQINVKNSIDILKAS